MPEWERLLTEFGSNRVWLDNFADFASAFELSARRGESGAPTINEHYAETGDGSGARGHLAQYLLPARLTRIVMFLSLYVIFSREY
jgi:hypothetical protein